MDTTCLTDLRRQDVRRTAGRNGLDYVETGDGPVTLTVRADADRYTFLCSTEHDELQTLASGETRYLSTEVAGGFTGVYFALYATGSGRISAAPAFFSWFDYRA